MIFSQAHLHFFPFLLQNVLESALFFLVIPSSNGLGLEKSQTPSPCSASICTWIFTFGVGGLTGETGWSLPGSAARWQVGAVPVPIPALWGLIYTERPTQWQDWVTRLGVNVAVPVSGYEHYQVSHRCFLMLLLNDTMLNKTGPYKD